MSNNYVEQKNLGEQTEPRTPFTDAEMEQVDGGRFQICNTASTAGNTAQTFRCAHCQKEYTQLPANGICESCGNSIHSNATAQVRFI